MKKIKVVLVLVVLVTGLLACADNTINSDDMKREINKHKSSNICIISASKHDDMCGYSAGASGIIVGKNQGGYYALTAYHVVNKEKTNFLIRTVLAPDMEEYRKKHRNMITSVDDYYKSFPIAQVVYSNEKNDLAIIYFETKEELEVAKISDNNPQKSDFILTVGSYSEKMEYFVVTAGEIKKSELMRFKTDDQNTENQVLQHSAFTAKGFSGGGVYNRDMQLVGMNIGGATNVLGKLKYSVMIPCEQIQNCIEESQIPELQRER